VRRAGVDRPSGSCPRPADPGAALAATRRRTRAIAADPFPPARLDVGRFLALGFGFQFALDL
jgi:hypothetical protein